MIKFGVFSDLHVDLMHDTLERLEKFLEACRKENVDFIIQLGDFCYPETRKCICKPEHRPENIENALKSETYADKDRIISLYKNFEKPSYHVLGNHDSDMCSKKDILDFYGNGDSPYYSFDMGGFHFVVIDGNYYKIGDKYYSYENGNYFDCPFEDGTLPWIPPEELQWLKEDLEKAAYPAVLFSHQRLMEGYASVKNHAQLREIIKNSPKGVVMAINGHEHLDNVEKVDDTWFYNLNSMSNMWVGSRNMELNKLGEEIDRKYPNIRYVIPYSEPIYSIVTLDEKGATIKGTKGEQIGKTADEMGLNGKNGVGMRFVAEITAASKDRYLEF